MNTRKQKGGRPIEPHTDELLEVIRKDFVNLFVIDGSFVMPSYSDIENVILKHKSLRGMKKDTARLCIARYKSKIKQGFEEDLNVHLSEVVVQKGFGRKMTESTTALLNLVISDFPFLVTEKQKCNSEYYSQILARSEMEKFRVGLTPKRIHDLLHVHHKNLCNMC